MSKHLQFQEEEHPVESSLEKRRHNPSVETSSAEAGLAPHLKQESKYVERTDTRMQFTKGTREAAPPPSKRKRKQRFDPSLRSDRVPPSKSEAATGMPTSGATSAAPPFGAVPPMQAGSEAAPSSEEWSPGQRIEPPPHSNVAPPEPGQQASPPLEPQAEPGPDVRRRSRLQFAEDETPPPSEKKGAQRVEKLEQKSEQCRERLGKAHAALPKQIVKSKKLIYDEKKGKAKSKIIFEEQSIPIHKAKWNQPKKKSLSKRMGDKAKVTAINKVHAKIYEVEHENVGTKAAHRGELVGESAYRRGKKIAGSAYRHYKNRPYRKASKLEVKSLKADAKLSYQRAVRDKPNLGSNPLSRFFQKRAFKRKYAASIRNAKKSGKMAKKSVGIVGKLSKLATNIIRRNPVFLLKLSALGLMIILLMGLFSMCMNMLSGGTVFVGAVTYAADYEAIDDASILYTELETDLKMYLRYIEQNHPGFHEYRYDVGPINHDPFALMAYLTAVHGEFTFAEVEPVLRELFALQYQLSLTPEVVIRTRIENGVEVQYEWRILHVTLQSRPLTGILFSRMTSDERQHFNILMASRGARQFVGNPFGFNWLPHVSSRYGYRIHPIDGDKRFHAGIDIGLPTGTEILAGFDGTVTQVAYDADGWGNFVVIDNGEGIQALYAHCHTVLVSQGQGVSKGDVIATVGSTGASTGPHLHMEVIRHGRRLNPLFFVITGCEGGPGGLQYGDARPLTPEEFAILYAEARSHLGTPYVYGANGPHAFDCSSFVAWVYRHSGIYPLARTTAQGIFNQSIPIPMSHLSPGDIVFFQGTYSTIDTVTHVGIYLGGGMMIHAGRPVNITSIHTPFWQNHWFSAGRLRW